MDIQINVPKLRFAGFNGKWSTHKLSVVFEVLESGVSVNSIDTPAASEKELGVLKTSCVSSGKFFPEENKTIIADDVDRARLNPFTDAILISRMNTPQLVGECGLIDKNYPNLFIPDRLWQGRVSKSFFNPKLISLMLASENFRFRLTSIATGTSGSMKNISQPNFLGLDLTLPSLPEQQKIASFLTKVDKKLTQLKKKKALLEQYKKGMMQKIFSQEIRFKDDDGEEFSEWGEKSLKQIAEKRTEKNKENHIKNVLTNSAAHGIINQRDYFDKDIANQNNLLGYYIVEKDDFVYNPRISNLAPVGPIGRNHQKTGVMSPLYSVFRIKDGCLSFYELYFTTNFWHEYMESIANYGARFDRMNVTTKDFYEMPLPYPCLQEQAKIANFLSVMDKKIDHTQTQIDKAEQWKKGLLQQMFV